MPMLNSFVFYSSVQKFGACMIIIFFKDINTFIQQEWIKLIKRDSLDIYNVTKDLYF